MDLASAAAIVKSANSVSSKGKECVKVVVRCRPMSKKESAENRKTIVSMSLDTAVISLQNPAKEHGDKTFTFDSVYDESTEQVKILYQQQLFFVTKYSILFLKL